MKAAECGCMHETLKEAVDTWRRLERRLGMSVRKLCRRLQMSAEDVKEGCGCMQET